VTKTRVGTATDAYTPDEILVQQYASAHPRLDKQKLTAALTEFGPLPKAGQEQLIRCLVRAFAEHQLRKKMNERDSTTYTMSRQRDDLNEIKKSTAKLLRQLGIDVRHIAPPELWYLSNEVSASQKVRMLGKQTKHGVMLFHWISQSPTVTSNRDPKIVNAELRQAGEDVADSILAILRLHGRATAATRAASSRTRPARGGARRKPTVKGQLIRDAIAIYGHVRGKFPDSGNKRGAVLGDRQACQEGAGHQVEQARYGGGVDLGVAEGAQKCRGCSPSKVSTFGQSEHLRGTSNAKSAKDGSSDNGQASPRAAIETCAEPFGR
jgi:hypothetical protein